jgi:hypothetical protein
MEINKLAVAKTSCQMSRIGNPFVQRFPDIQADFQPVQLHQFGHCPAKWPLVVRFCDDETVSVRF